MLAYEVVDVFTDRAFAGNPLAVVLGGEDLTTAQMAALAVEFNLSETAFPRRVAEGEGVDYELRIFTPMTELPFAGHPSVGAAWLMAAVGRVQPGRVVQRCGAGDLPLAVAPGPGAVTLTGGTPTAGKPLDPAPLLAAVGLTTADLAGPPARQAGTGLEWTYLPVRADAVARARLDGVAMRAARDTAPHGVYVHAWDATTATAHARAFMGTMGIEEDPATGSAALGLGVHLVASGLLAPDGPSDYTVRQGLEMGRPSTIAGTVDAEGGAAVRVRVWGRVVPVASGTIRVP